ncbi:hypothetical protein Tco_0425502 [Tanacetum coccineum]
MKHWLVQSKRPWIDGLEKDLQQTKKTYSTALTKLVLRVKKLEYKLKSGKARLVLFEGSCVIQEGSAKDKGKAIMEESATPKKVKKRTQVQLSMDEELARKMEERARFNAEQEAKALQEEEERLNNRGSSLGIAKTSR